MKKILRFMAGLALCFGPAFLLAQKVDPETVARQFIDQQVKAWGLEAADVENLQVIDRYRSAHNGVTHLYLLQEVEGIPVYNGMINLNINRSGRVIHFGNRLIAGISQRYNRVEPVIPPRDAVLAAAKQLGHPLSDGLKLKEKSGPNKQIYSGSQEEVRNDIPVHLCFQLLGNGSLRLAWDLSLDLVGTDDYWSVRVDAETGTIIDRNNYTVYCQFSETGTHDHQVGCFSGGKAQAAKTSLSAIGGEGTYRVFAIPVESPIHGMQSLVVAPQDTVASPLGWHDTDGIPGPEYTITRGNNVHAFLDLNNQDVSQGDEPDGGPDLIFDFPYDYNAEPSALREAAVTNLFYMNNIMHDVFQRYGFDEPAGNFQETNYSAEGRGGDFVLAQAQDGGGTNNANFATPPDGANGRMQMYLWGRNSNLLRIDAPNEIAGWYNTGTASFGPAVDEDTNISGQVVEVDDGVFDPFNTDGCEPFSASTDLEGKIALVDRGGCFFEQKTANAEAAGAIAVILCNFEEDPNGMGGVPQISDPGIPTVSLGNADCAVIRQFIVNGVVATISAEPVNGPNQVDGDFDNGIIAHEYAHGISNRLTGGPSSGGCLSNEEQMGEGWSDFFTLITSVRPDDNGSLSRGIGTFAQRQDPTGRGIRPYPYSTDFSINPLTYKDISQLSIPHGLGSVWCTMIWDLYWAFVEEYGFDEDLIGGSGGNNMAIQLVMDGMKMQPCQPGFADGRDAILAADQELYGGANECLIWEVFARRGLGYFADQGDPNNAADGVESFEPKPTCVKELKIVKTVTPSVNPGDAARISLRVTNHKDGSASQVVVSDELPAGLTFTGLDSVSGLDISAIAVNTDVPGIVSFSMGDLESLGEIELYYTAVTDPNRYSTRLFFDDIPDNSLNTELNWDIDIQSDQSISTNIWRISDQDAYSGDWSWNVDDHPMDTRQVLVMADNILLNATQPVLRFRHRIDSYPGNHGGVVEVSENDGFTFANLDQAFFRNGYSGQISYFAFTIPRLSAFFGKSGEFVESFADLDAYSGKDIKVRFRFGTRDTTEFSSSFSPNYYDYFGTPDGGEGWYVDDVEVLDMFNYDGEACVSSEEGDMACAKAPGKGIFVEPKTTTTSLDNIEAQTVLTVFPNPMGENLQVGIQTAVSGIGQLGLYNAAGKLLRSSEVRFSPGYLQESFFTGTLPSGMYFIRFMTDRGIISQKVLKF